MSLDNRTIIWVKWKLWTQCSPTFDAGFGDPVWLNIAVFGNFCAFPPFPDTGVWGWKLPTPENTGLGFCSPSSSAPSFLRFNG